MFTERSGGWERLDAVPTGARVLAADAVTGELAFSPLLAWWHHDEDKAGRFLRLTAASGAQLTLSPQHYLHASPAGCDADATFSSAALTLAADVRPGWGLWVLSEPRGAVAARGALICSRVVSIAAVQEPGMFAPVSASGNVVVDGVSASSLVAYGPWPLRVLRAHHALLVWLHNRAGALGLAILDAAHAPFYALRGIGQPTNARVARALAAKAAKQEGQAAAWRMPVADVSIKAGSVCPATR